MISGVISNFMPKRKLRHHDCVKRSRQTLNSHIAGLRSLNYNMAAPKKQILVASTVSKGRKWWSCVNEKTSVNNLISKARIECVHAGLEVFPSLIIDMSQKSTEAPPIKHQMCP